MRTDSPQTIFRKDYTPPSYLVETVELGFDLDPARTIVANRITLRHNPDSKGLKNERDIVLHGEDIELVALRLNGTELNPGQYILGANTLTIKKARSMWCWKSKARARRKKTPRCPACMCPTAISSPSARPRASARSLTSPTGRT
jgi:aminopeptidase N